MKQISEWVSVGHPDKTADYISQYILDRYIEKDPLTRYAVEVQIKGNRVCLGGEITSLARYSNNQTEEFIREALREIGYTLEYAERWGRDNVPCADCMVAYPYITQQSRDITRGVEALQGWGDQGIFFGYAVYDKSCPNFLPADHELARFIGEGLYKTAKEHPEKGWGIDIKVQVVLPEGSRNPERVIVAMPLLPDSTTEDPLYFVRGVLKMLGAPQTEIIINGTGRYVQHGSMADCGTTGRKLAVDFYGGNCRIGGGSPWTKDASKADLTLNLYARELAVQKAKEYQQTVTVSLGCCIGRPEVDYSIYNEQGETLDEGVKIITPAELRERYDLDTPIYAAMCALGLFGSNFNWDK